MLFHFRSIGLHGEKVRRISGDPSADGTDLPKVVILGAGFGGLWAARTLSRAAVTIDLIDRHNYHTFFPLLYEVGAAELEPEDIAYPVRSILRHATNVRFWLETVEQVNLAAKTVETTERVIHYDYLIIALGSTSHFFGVPGAATFAFPLKTLEQGVALRNHVLSCFERAAYDSDALRRQRLLTFAIVGGGPTGVEFTGALAELVRGPLAKDYPTLKGQARITVLEAGDGLLAGQPQSLKDYALKRLEQMDVQVQLHARVTRVTPEEVQLQDGQVIPTETVIWTAGVNGTPVINGWGLPTNRTGQVTVMPTLQVPGHPEVYVVGDLAYVEQADRPLPMLAQPALQEGVAVAHNIERQVHGVAPVPFRYRDLGTLAVIGRNAGVANMFGHAYTGFVAWANWLVVHIFNLIGFRNRLIVLINWAWDYVFFERGIRLILPSKQVVETRPLALDLLGQSLPPSTRSRSGSDDDDVLAKQTRFAEDMARRNSNQSK
jgi:NADH dehydrogenase